MTESGQPKTKYFKKEIQNMKKILALVLTLTMVMALCAFSPAAFADEADDYYIELTYSNVFNPKE